MAKTDKLIQKILQGRSDASIGFEELRLLKREGAKAKPCQVRQVRAMILKYRLRVDDDV